MPNEYNGKNLKLWTLATYRIKVEGELDESFSDRLGGMRILRPYRRASVPAGEWRGGRKSGGISVMVKKCPETVKRICPFNESLCLNVECALWDGEKQCCDLRK